MAVRVDWWKPKKLLSLFAQNKGEEMLRGVTPICWHPNGNWIDNDLGRGQVLRPASGRGQ